MPGRECHQNRCLPERIAQLEPQASKELAQREPRNKIPLPLAEGSQSDRMGGASLLSRCLPRRTGWLMWAADSKLATSGSSGEGKAKLCLPPPSSLSSPSPPQSRWDIDLGNPRKTLHVPSELSWLGFYSLEFYQSLEHSGYKQWSWGWYWVWNSVPTLSMCACGVYVDKELRGRGRRVDSMHKKGPRAFAEG